MKISPATDHGKPVWRVNYSLLGKQKRKFFPRDPVKRKQCEGYTEAQKFAAEQTKKVFYEGPTFAALSATERVECVTFYFKVGELGFTHQEALDVLMRNARVAPKVPETVKECIGSKEVRGLRERYIKQLRHVLSKFAGAFANTQIDRVTPHEIESWIRRGELKPASRRSRQRDVNTLFAFAKKRDYIKDNPCDKIDKIKVTPTTPGILRPRAAAKLMRVAFIHDRRLCPWLALALFCGIRPEELNRMDRIRVMLEKRLVEVTFEMSKTTKRRLVKIPDNAAEWLQIKGDLAEVRKGKDGKERLMGPINLKKRFDRVRRKAGLFKNWPHDAMRHSSATYSYALTEDAAYVAKQHGHTVDMLLRNYNAIRTPDGAVVTKEMAEEFFSIRPQPIVSILESAA